MASSDARVRLDLNNPVFQDNLLTLQKPERHAVFGAGLKKEIQRSAKLVTEFIRRTTVKVVALAGRRWRRR